MTDMAVMVLFVDIPVMGVNRLILRPVLTLEEQGERHFGYTINPKKESKRGLVCYRKIHVLQRKGQQVTPECGVGGINMGAVGHGQADQWGDYPPIRF